MAQQLWILEEKYCISSHLFSHKREKLLTKSIRSRAIVCLGSSVLLHKDQLETKSTVESLALKMNDKLYSFCLDNGMITSILPKKPEHLTLFLSNSNAKYFNEDDDNILLNHYIMKNLPLNKS